MNNLITALRASLRNLSCEYATQVNIFPANVVVADELALDFDSALKGVSQSLSAVISDEQRAVLQRLNKHLDDMSGEAKKELWTNQALENSLEWEGIRKCARDALKSFGWDQSEASGDRGVYYSK